MNLPREVRTAHRRKSHPETFPIVITGLGAVSALGCGVATLRRAMTEGRCGIRPIEVPWETGYRSNHAGFVEEGGPPPFTPGHGASEPARVRRFAETAAREALGQAGFEPDGRRFAVVLGTTWGEALEVEHDLLRHDPPRDPFGRLSGDLRRGLALPGCDFTVTTTCAAGNHAIAMATDLLRAGTVDRALAVGADALCYAVLLGFSRLLLQDPHGCRPFDLNRNGTVIGEGAAALVLERADDAAARGAEILAEVAGCGLSCDAAGTFASNSRDVRSLEVAARAALAQARMNPDAIDHVSAHASGTRLNDAKETCFLKSLLGQRSARVPVNGIKSMLGHAQGAAALLEAVACVLTLRHDVLFPTINLETPDPACDLDYVPNRARPARVRNILSNAFGMGGTNAIAIFRRWEGP